MADSSIELNAGTGGSKLDTESLTGAGGATVQRERMQIAGLGLANVAKVTNADAGPTDQGVVVRPAPPVAPATASLVNVSNATSNATALSASTIRKGATFFNDDTAASVYLKCGTTASSTSFTVKIPPGGYYELPLMRDGVYTGRIDVIATAATGTLRVSEFT